MVVHFTADTILRYSSYCISLNNLLSDNTPALHLGSCETRLIQTSRDSGCWPKQWFLKAAWHKSHSTSYFFFQVLHNDKRQTTRSSADFSTQATSLACSYFCIFNVPLHTIIHKMKSSCMQF